MALLDRFAALIPWNRPGSVAREPQAGLSTDDLLEALELAFESRSGVRVTRDAALRCAVALACCRVLAEGLAQVPLKLLRQDGRVRAEARDHPLWRVLHRAPNGWMTSFELRETLMYHALLCFNAFAFKNRVDGRIRELIPIDPAMVRVEQTATYETLYHIEIKGERRGTFTRREIFHLRGPSWNGAEGLDFLQLAREALGLAIATERNHSEMFKRGTRHGGLIALEGTLSAEAKTSLLQAWNDSFAGSRNAYKTAVLDHGAKFHPMQMTGVDAQHIEVRKHQVEEVCRTFRVFPLLVMQSDKAATFASAEQFFIAHVIHSLGPWYERWEQAIDMQLLSEEEQIGGLYSKFAVQGLMRGDANTRAEFYRHGILDGWMSRNEAREREDMNPADGLDEFLRPSNEEPVTTGDGGEDADQSNE